MGAKVSKLWDCLSMHDDLVADNDDVVAEAWYGAKGVWGLPPRAKPLLLISSVDVLSYKLVDIYDDNEAFSPGQDLPIDLIPVGLPRANAEAAAGASPYPTSAALAEPAGGPKTAQASHARPECPAAVDSFAGSTMCGVTGPASGNNTSAAASAHPAADEIQQHGTSKQAGADESSSLALQAPTTSAAAAPETSAGDAAAAAARSCAQGGATEHCQQQVALASVMDPSLRLLEVSKVDRDAVTAAAAAARQKVEQMFANVDHKQQQQDKEHALAALAAARGPKPIISAEEKQALRAAGKAAQEAASAKLATQLQEADTEMQQMSDDSRAQWFQEHACQTTADAAAEAPFEDEWSSLPPEVLAMVQELKSRK